MPNNKNNEYYNTLTSLKEIIEPLAQMYPVSIRTHLREIPILKSSIQKAGKYLENVLPFIQDNCAICIYHTYMRHYVLLILICSTSVVCSVRTTAQYFEIAALRNPDYALSSAEYKNELFYEITDAMDASKYNLDSNYHRIYKAYQESIKTGHHRNRFQSSLFLGILHSIKGEYHEAHKWFVKAIEYSYNTGNPLHHLCRAINNIGNIFYFQGDYQRAIQYYFQIIPIAEQAIPEHPIIVNPLTRIYTSTAMVLFGLQDYEKALYYLNKAEILAKQYSDSYHIAPIYAHKGQVYGHMGNIKQARYYNNLALQAGRELNNEEVQFIALYNMAMISESPKKALSFIRKAQNLQGNINAYYKTSATGAMGTIYLKEKNYTLAFNYLTQAESLATRYHMPQILLEINQHLANLHDQTGNFKKAHDYRLFAYKLNDSLLNKEKTLAINALEIKYRTAQKDMELSRKQLLINQQEQELSRNNIIIGISTMGILMLTSISLFLFVLNRNNRHRQSLQQQKIRSLEQEQEIRELKAVMTGEEKERTRLARELHDGIGGMLAAIKMNFSSLKKQYAPVLTETGEPEKTNGFTKIMELINTTGIEIRETAHNLMPDILTRHGLAEALNLFTSKINSGNDVYIKLQTEGKINDIPQSIQLSLYRIIQELVQNITKHASASIALIHISLSRDGITHILIRDNGKGFDPGTTTEGIGLQNVRSRVKILHGTLSVTTAPREGTTIEVRLNIKELKDTSA